jgi:hypothetical protein
MKRVRVYVRKADIEAGEPSKPWSCPVALAIQRATGCVPAVGSETFDIEQHRELPLPPAAQNFIHRFDAGNPVAPFGFIARIPE